jgi:dihydrofolate reductase
MLADSGRHQLAVTRLSARSGPAVPRCRIRDNVIESVRALKNQPGRDFLTDGSSQLVHALLQHDLVDELHLLLYPLTLGSGKRRLPAGGKADRRLAIRRTPAPVSGSVERLVGSTVAGSQLGYWHLEPPAALS